MSSRRYRFAFALTLAGGLVLGACDDPAEPPPGGEQELITRVTLSLTPSGGGATVSAIITDPDGLGPEPPSAPSQTLTLTAGESYDGTIEFADASDPSDVVDITEEVAAEADAHRVFYTVSGVTGVAVTDLDEDDNGAPLGLTFTVNVTAAASGSGTIRVVLSHYDEGPKGDGSMPSDETDVDVTFTIDVQ